MAPTIGWSPAILGEPPTRRPLREDAALCRETESALLRTRHFAHVSPELVRAVLGQGFLVRVPAGETLIRQGSEEIDTMYALLEGTLDVLVDGRHIVSLSEPGEAIGELSPISRQPRSAEVRAQTDCTLVEIPVRAVSKFRSADPERYIQFLELIALYLGGKLAQTTRRVRTYEELLLEREQLRSHSRELERLVQEKLHEVLLYSHVFRNSQDGILIADARGSIISANLAMIALFGWKDWQPGKLSILDWFPDLRGRLDPLLEPQGSGFKADWLLPNTVHGEMPVEATYTPVGQNGRVIALAFFLRDIRGYKLLLESLQESQLQLAQHSKDLERQVEERTLALRRSNEELQATNVKLRQETQSKDAALETLKKTQSHLLQSEKMIGLGHLAAGVAHEINNPIGFVISNLNTMKEYLGQIRELLALYAPLENRSGRTSAEAAGIAERVGALKRKMDYDFVMKDAPQVIADAEEGAARVAAIVRNLKEFTHLDQAQKQWVNVNDGLESAIRLIWNELKYKARVVRDYGEIAEIECYPQQLNQAFLNLLMNAVQAIEKEGTITVRTRPDGDGIAIQVQDDGCGIAPEDLPHIYEPFFTTKPVGQGMGLGLTSAYTIVRSHHGTIDVESRRGAGTTFTLRLPLRQPEHPSSAPDP
jgi:PAS domain S-box-containing protein